MSRYLLSTAAFILSFPFISIGGADVVTHPVIVQTDAGEFQIAVELNDAGFANLEGVSFNADLVLGEEIMAVNGEFTDGIVGWGILTGAAYGVVSKPFEIIQDTMNLTVETADISFQVSENQLSNAELMNVLVQTELNIGDKLLVLAGSVEGGYHEGKVDLQGSLSVKNDFTYSTGPVTATLKTGDQLSINIAESDFQFVSFKDLEIFVEVPVDNQTLKLDGDTSGKLNKDFTIDIEGSVSVVENFTFSTGPVTATLKTGDQLSINIAQSEFQFVSFKDLEIFVEIVVDNQPLRLLGTGPGKYEDLKIDFEGSVSVVEDFTFSTGSVTATLKTGDQLSINIAQSEFQFVSFKDLEIFVEIVVDNQPLRLLGPVSGSINKNYKVDFEGSVSVVEDFTFSTGPVTATLKTGDQIFINIEQGELQYIQFKDLEIFVKIPLDNQPLKLEGNVSGSINKNYKVDFEGSISVQEDITYQEGVVSTHLKSGTPLTVKVEESEFIFAEFQDLDVVVEIPNDDGALPLRGPVNGKINEQYKLDFEGSMSVEQDFTYETGDVSATFMSGDHLTVEISRSKLRIAKFQGVDVLVEVTIEDKDLKLRGEVRGTINENYEVDFKGSINVEEDFTYEKGDVSAMLVAGDPLEVKVSQSEFKEAEFQGLDVLVEVSIEDQVLSLQGKVEGNINKNYEIDFKGSIELKNPFTYEKGRVRTTIAPQNIPEVVVRNSEFNRADLAGVLLEVVIEVPGGDVAQLTGQITKGKLKLSELEYGAEVIIVEVFEYTEDGETVVVNPQAGTLRVSSKYVEFKGDDARFKFSTVEDDDQDQERTEN